MRSHSISAAACLAVLLFAATAQAVTEKPIRLKNESYNFAYTVEANCEVTYQEGGVGFSASHLPAGSDPNAKGVKADYGLMVYGAPMMHLSKKEAEAVKFPPFEEKTFAPSELPEGISLSDVITSNMKLAGRDPAGQATVQVEGGKALSVPYFMWSQKIAGQTRHAFMYVVEHDDAFIYVQAESPRPFSKQLITQFTTKLELLKPPADPAPQQ